MRPRVVENSFEELARLRKAIRYVDAFRAHDWTADEVLDLTEEQWQQLADGLQLNVPSPLTLDIILAELVKREAEDTDPFEEAGSPLRPASSPSFGSAS